MNLNRAILIGRLTRDPETRTTPSGQTLAQFGLATNRIWNDQSGQKQEDTQFHNIVAWGRLAEICSQYLRKGSLVMVEGRIQTRSWQSPEGVTKYRTEIVADNVQLGPRSASQTGPASPDVDQHEFTPPRSEEPINQPMSKTIPPTPTINLDKNGNPIEEMDLNEQKNPGEPPSTVMPF